MMSGPTSIDAVKKKIRVLQEQAEEAMERAEKLQKEVEKERKAKEEVLFFSIIQGAGGGGGGCVREVSKKCQVCFMPGVCRL